MEKHVPGIAFCEHIESARQCACARKCTRDTILLDFRDIELRSGSLWEAKSVRGVTKSASGDAGDLCDVRTFSA